MSKATRCVAPIFASILTLLSGCADPAGPVDTAPQLNVGCAPDALVCEGEAEEPAGELVYIDGQEFWADYASNKLIPTSEQQSILEKWESKASLRCDGDSCLAHFMAYHDGRWDVSTQTFDWTIEDGTGRELAGTETKMDGGVTCSKYHWTGMCERRWQHNTLPSGDVATTECRVKARTTTTHYTAYNAMASITWGNISINATDYGAQRQISNAAAPFDDCDAPVVPKGPCDDPVTPETEPCPPDGSGTPGTGSTTGGTTSTVTSSSTTSNTGSVYIIETCRWVTTYTTENGQTRITDFQYLGCSWSIEIGP